MLESTVAAPEKQRIDYIDTLRFLAMFAVYIGHLAEASGPIMPFVYHFHVPLFFCISGCMERLSSPCTFPQYLNKKIRSILIPWLFFALVSVAIFCLNENADWESTLASLRIVLQGCTVNAFYASALWFLTGLFVMSLAFFWLKRLKSPVVILLVTLGLYLLAMRFFPDIVIDWHWNVGGVCKYMLYYAVGYFTFPALRRFLGAVGVSAKATAVFALTACIAAGYAVLVYYEKDPIGWLSLPQPLTWVAPLARAFVLIWLAFAVAFLLRRVAAFLRAGQCTIYLCGSEFIVSLVPGLVRQLGLSLYLTSPLMSVLYTMLLLFIAVKWLVPVEKRIVAAITAGYDRLLGFCANACARGINRIESGRKPR